MELQSPSQGKSYLQRAIIPSVILIEYLSRNHGDAGTVNKLETSPAFMAPTAQWGIWLNQELTKLHIRFYGRSIGCNWGTQEVTLTKCQGVLEQLLVLVTSKLSHKGESDPRQVNKYGGRIEGKHVQKNEGIQGTKIAVCYDVSYGFSMQSGEKISPGKTQYSFSKLGPGALPKIQRIDMNELLFSSPL